jgi:RHS repeat-associated protein
MIDYTVATPKTYCYILDVHGNVVALADETGNRVVNYDYDAWGNLTNTPESVTTGNGEYLRNANPFRYSSYQYDPESGLYYLKARYYSSSFGRFLTRDILYQLENGPIMINQYANCENNPVRYVDPTGHFIWAVVGAISVGAIAYLLGKKWGLTGWKLALFALIGAGIGAIVGNALTPLLKPLAYTFINWGKAIGIVSTVWGYKLMIHWPHHGKGIHIVLQHLTKAGNWRMVFEKTFWR